ncbi:mitochondrial pyruvate dehydrogenase kinase-like protein [Leptodontidium sp. 2 PMI_412]|nr:mitochondrial pyruvate dehydrogenase kinase-like protein [Leptodontidium sp. 2 PMI_412]
MKCITRPSRSFRGVIPIQLSIAGLYNHRTFTQHSFRARHPSPAAHKWSHPPSSTTIADDDVASLASEQLHALSLADLVKEGRPPLSEKALFSSANFTLSLLPIRLAHRIQALRNLPFIVVSNPNISTIYNNYLHSLSTLLPYKSRTISTLEDEIKFTSVLADLVETHSHTIPTLARGFLECRKYINPDEVTRFLDEHLRARIGTRLIAEQHIALHLSSQPHQNNHVDSPEADPSSSYIGVIDTALQPASIINSCGNFVSEICELKYGVRPTWIIDGEPGTTFAYVPVHLEYIITELLKNAFRATVESGRSHEPIVITIAAEPESPRGGLSRTEQGNNTAPIDSNSPIRPFEDPAPGVTIRIRDRGGGISPEVLPDIWSYSFTTFSDEDLPGVNGSMDALNALSGGGGGEGSSIAGLGYGLPLGRAYAEYFGGGIAVQSLYGWGCDVYLRLKGLGKPKS